MTDAEKLKAEVEEVKNTVVKPTGMLALLLLPVVALDWFMQKDKKETIGIKIAEAGVENWVKKKKVDIAVLENREERAKYAEERMKVLKKAVAKEGTFFL